MDYEKKYKEALERAKGMWEQGMMPERIEYIFPELKESEDERIRKDIIRVFKGEISFTAEEDNKKYIAWLKKQGEQKPVDKDNIEFNVGYRKNNPRFEVEDWVVLPNNEVKQIEGITFGNYWFTDKTLYNIIDTDNKGHLWTIQDAKDGDVLYSLDSKKPFLYKERLQFSQARGYCCINEFGEFAVWNTTKCVICTDKYIPATKEQRDILFQKMKEAGYMWDAEKKELKKIEMQVEQKSAWSEHQHKLLNYAISMTDDTEVKCFLESLRNTGSNTSADWSEEDEKLYTSALWHIKNSCGNGGKDSGEYEVYNWLKSLKERYTWKPSEEQMEALEHFVRSIGESGYASPYNDNTKLLYSLLNDIKNL